MEKKMEKVKQIHQTHQISIISFFLLFYHLYKQSANTNPLTLGMTITITITAKSYKSDAKRRHKPKAETARVSSSKTDSRDVYVVVSFDLVSSRGSGKTSLNVGEGFFNQRFNQGKML